MFDAVSYILGNITGVNKAKGTVILKDGSEYRFTDPNHDGHIVIEEVEEANNG